MKLVIFCHPDFQGSDSMPRFARMLGKHGAEFGLAWLKFSGDAALDSYLAIYRTVLARYGIGTGKS